MPVPPACGALLRQSAVVAVSPSRRMTPVVEAAPAERYSVTPTAPATCRPSVESVAVSIATSGAVSPSHTEAARFVVPVPSAVTETWIGSPAVQPLTLVEPRLVSVAPTLRTRLTRRVAEEVARTLTPQEPAAVWRALTVV